uniref:PH domain-containing protein n=1 Tax=Haptolina brevifila TaxID=156173 RepID=A0A7S2HQG3_9EUKA|mmetsp:Transcript_56768/g.112725  ORF Transcript_56768/g.112725 Transcript_56768/m.112725 type:complete len:552 (+) Transcript_56768:11-1666(+)
MLIRRRPTFHCDAVDSVPHMSEFVGGLIRSASFSHRRSRAPPSKAAQTKNATRRRGDSTETSETDGSESSDNGSRAQTPVTEPVMQDRLFGWLQKKHRASRGRQWGRRFFFVDESQGTLAYAKGVNGTVSAVLPLADISHIELDPDEPCAMIVHCPPIHLTVAAVSIKERDNWKAQLELRMAAWRSMQAAQSWYRQPAKVWRGRLSPLLVEETPVIIDTVPLPPPKLGYRAPGIAHLPKAPFAQPAARRPSESGHATRLTFEEAVEHQPASSEQLTLTTSARELEAARGKDHLASDYLAGWGRMRSDAIVGESDAPCAALFGCDSLAQVPSGGTAQSASAPLTGAPLAGAPLADAPLGASALGETIRLDAITLDAVVPFQWDSEGGESERDEDEDREQEREQGREWVGRLSEARRVGARSLASLVSSDEDEDEDKENSNGDNSAQCRLTLRDEAHGDTEGVEEVGDGMEEEDGAGVGVRRHRPTRRLAPSPSSTLPRLWPRPRLGVSCSFSSSGGLEGAMTALYDTADSPSRYTYNDRAYAADAAAAYGLG